MRIDDAPPAGWYPDPEGSSRLRYWEGTDWSNRFRARPPSSASTELLAAAAEKANAQQLGFPSNDWQSGRQDTAQIVDQVRQAARQEAERAAEMFGQQARAAARNVQPLISEYTSKITRGFKIATRLAILLAIVWFAFQFFAQQSLFEWIGDRIDNVTDSRGMVVGVLLGG